MGRLIPAALAIGVGMAMASCARSSPVSPTSSLSAPTQARAAVAIISIDGLRPDAVLSGGAPNILALTGRGAYSWSAQTILPSNTLPSHVSMLTGFLPEAHGITWDDYLPSRGQILVPTLFNAARAAGLRTALFAGKKKFTHFRDSGCCDVWQCCTGGDQDLAGQASVEASAGIDLLVVHLPDVDLAGHANQWMSEGYLAAVRRADDAVGRIVGSLPPYATFIVTADHGGHPTGHGTADSLDTTIPWIIVGPAIVQGRPLSSPIRTVDTAATAAYVLGISLPAGVTGRPVLEAFNR